MKSVSRFATLFACGLIGLALSGCQTYRVETRVNADGGGERVTKLDAESEVEAPTRALLGLTGAWREETIERQEQPRLIHRFTRERAVGSAAEWSTLPPDLLIRSDADGHATLAERVTVEMRRDGAERRCIYREVIGWRYLRETVADAFADFLDKALRDTLPQVAPQTRAELRGMIRGYVVAGWSDLTASDDHGGSAERLVEFFIADSGRIAARAGGADEGARIARVMRRLLFDPDGNLKSDPLDRLPGVELSGESSLELQLTLPGEIAESNADEVKGRTAFWRVDLGKALDADIELKAEAKLGS